MNPMILVETVLPVGNAVCRQVDELELEWYEAVKSIIRRKTKNGVEVAVRKEGSKPLEDGDLLWQDGDRCIIVAIRPCDCIVVQPESVRAMGIICFEVGNRHIPLFIDEAATLLMAYEHALFELLVRLGFDPVIERRKLSYTQSLRPTVHTGPVINPSL